MKQGIPTEHFKTAFQTFNVLYKYNINLNSQ